MKVLHKTQKVLQSSFQALADSGSHSPQLDAELLLCHVLSCYRIDLLKKQYDTIDQKSFDSFQQLLQRRLAQEPIAYILGHQEFYGHSFTVTPATLIPRPESELLIEAASKYLKNFPETARVIDIGTGSACLAISLALLHPKLSITAVDIHKDTLEVAQKNARDLGVVNIKFNQENALAENFWQQKPSYDLIISNPPYIGRCEQENLAANVLNYEPSCALFADNDGLKFYETYAQFGKNILTPNGIMLLELSPIIYEKVCKIFLSQNWHIKETILDLAGHDRHIVLQR